MNESVRNLVLITSYSLPSGSDKSSKESQNDQSIWNREERIVSKNCRRIHEEDTGS